MDSSISGVNIDVKRMNRVRCHGCFREVPCSVFLNLKAKKTAKIKEHSSCLPLSQPVLVVDSKGVFGQRRSESIMLIVGGETHELTDRTN